jgi:Ser/Thr protein kinase RdoA (MazF antagonist)
MRGADDRLLLVDLYGAGVGPPIVDLAEVTTYLCRGPSASGPLMAEAARAFYTGYATHRRLTSEEIRLLPAAHLFHQVYYLADSLSRGDHDFLRRMSARLNNWNAGVLDTLAEIARTAP